MSQELFILETAEEVAEVVTAWQQANFQHLQELGEQGHGTEELLNEAVNRFSNLPIKSVIAVDTDVVPVVYA